jgi:DNA (cytosine-5)-methyltransferase 1
MWHEAVRAVNETKPLAFIFENVKGLTRASFSNYLAYIVQQLTYPEIKKNISEEWEDHLIRLERHHTSRKSYEGLTYQVAYRVLNAANYGVPQKRERVVFVGFRSDLGVAWAFPEETHSRAALVKSQSVGGTYWDLHGIAKGERNPLHEKIFFSSKSVQRDELKPWRTVRDAIGDLPDPEKSTQKASLFLNHKFQGGARSYVGHTGSPLDEPAKTLKAGVHGVPGGENMLVRPDGSVRYFSVRESARLQTFPDSYAFHGAWSETMRQLGNAVPVELSTVIAKSVHNSLSEIGSN